MAPADTAVKASVALHSDAATGKDQDDFHNWDHISGFFGLDPNEVHPLHAPAKPSQEALKKSVTAPVIVTPNPMVKQVFDGSSNVAQELSINRNAFTVSSSTFEGTMEVHLRGLPNSQGRVFDGKRRFFQVMVQGRFKRPVAADGLCMGQEFVKQPANMNPWIGEMILTAAAKVFSSSTQVDVKAKLPYFMNPVLAACQLVNVSEPGSEPKLSEATEDMRLFSADLADKKGNPVSSDKRRKWCDVPKNLAGKQFTPDHVYTFHIWQHLIDFSTYKANLGGLLNLDLTTFLNCQPLQLTCKDTSTDEYMFSMLVWHEKLLYPDTSSSTMSSLAEKLGKFSFGMGKWGSSK
eukprot:GHUV01000623.1.p1 GENE.GHUV01000623.1~~GHUV01000623.1.p1  ORF type:complete len:349 (+),score=116.38 GHUV01000623.1:263-1309(+)